MAAKSTADPIAFHPIAGSLGAEVVGVDLNSELAPDEISKIKQGLSDHLVLFFRDQAIDIEAQLAFTHHFGEPSPTPFIVTMKEHPEVIEIIKEADEQSRFVFGGGWHSDFSFLERPPYVTCLRAQDVPDYGGDTLWSNMILAYEMLPSAMKERIDGLIAIHSGERAYSPKMQALQDLLENMEVANTADAEIRREHPLVRRCPDTGRKGLYINPVYVVGIKDMDDTEAHPLLEELHRHALSEAFTCRFRWANNSIALWDNRFTQHYALGDYLGKRRHMFRTTTMGEVPC